MTTSRNRIYVGIDKDEKGAMNPTGNIIRDAWVFGIIPESETCEGWKVQDIEALYDKVTRAWEPFGHLVSNLPEDIRERHQRIYAAAVERGRREGWNPEMEEDSD